MHARNTRCHGIPGLVTAAWLGGARPVDVVDRTDDAWAADLGAAGRVDGVRRPLSRRLRTYRAPFALNDVHLERDDARSWPSDRLSSRLLRFRNGLRDRATRVSPAVALAERVTDLAVLMDEGVGLGRGMECRRRSSIQPSGRAWTRCSASIGPCIANGSRSSLRSHRAVSAVSERSQHFGAELEDADRFDVRARMDWGDVRAALHRHPRVGDDVRSFSGDPAHGVTDEVTAALIPEPAPRTHDAGWRPAMVERRMHGLRSAEWSATPGRRAAPAPVDRTGERIGRLRLEEIGMAARPLDRGRGADLGCAAHPGYV